MLLRDDKKGYASVIVKRIKGIPDYESMKSDNEKQQAPSLYGKKAEPEYEEKEMTKDFESGLDMASDKLMEAAAARNSRAFKTHLKSFIKMAMGDEDQYKD